MLNLKVEGNLNELFSTCMGIMLSGNYSWADAKQTPRLLSYNNLLHAGSLDFSFDLSHVGFTKTRWARYCHQYLNKEQLETWLEGLKTLSKRGDDLFCSNDAVRRPREHAHGSCWLGLSYRNSPPTLILYSRVAEFPTRAALELTLCHKVGLEISERLELDEPIKLVWFCSSLFFSCLHVIPYLAVNGILEETSSRGDAVGHFVKHQLDHMAKGKVKYGPTKRMQKRLEQVRAGTLKSVPISKLSLWI